MIEESLAVPGPVTEIEPVRSFPRGIVGAAAIIGLLLGLALAANAGSLLLDQEQAGSTRIGALAFTLVFTSPFLLALASTTPGPLELRRAILAGATTGSLGLAILGMFSVGLIFLIVTVFWAGSLWTSRNRDGASLRSVGLSTWISVGMIAAMFAMVGDRETACWNGSAWIERPTGSIVGGPTGFSHCTSGFIDDRSGSVSLIAVVFALLLPVALLIREHRKSA